MKIKKINLLGTHEMLVFILDSKSYVLGSQLAELLNRETFNLYRSMRIRKMTIKKASRKQVCDLLKLGILICGARSASFIHISHAIKFISEEYGFNPAHKRETKRNTRPKIKHNFSIDDSLQCSTPFEDCDAISSEDCNNHDQKESFGEALESSKSFAEKEVIKAGSSKVFRALPHEMPNKRVLPSLLCHPDEAPSPLPSPTPIPSFPSLAAFKISPSSAFSPISATSFSSKLQTQSVLKDSFSDWLWSGPGMKSLQMH